MDRKKDRRKFKVIKGKKDRAEQIPLQFVQAYVTNTRLMGVLGLRIEWRAESKPFYQFFHLDAEEYGIDDYIGLYGVTQEQVQMTTLQMMGGLGGDLIGVTEREARYLLSSFARKNKQWKNPLPEFEWEYISLLKEKEPLTSEEIQKLWNKICESLRSPFHLINYYVMRAAAMDQEAMQYLSASEEIIYQPVKQPSTLLKNVIEKIESGESVSYLTESIIDDGKHYLMVLSEIEITDTPDGLKVLDANVKSKMQITDTEAAFGLTKKEYILIYDVLDMGALMRQLDYKKPHAMKHGYENGYLYTEFNFNNDHVDRPVYYLNDDVYGVYYMTIADQLIVACYSTERLEELMLYLNGPDFEGILALEERLDLDYSILYEFVHSEYANFYDFLEERE